MKTIDLISQRRSVRTFDGRPLLEEDVAKITEAAMNAGNPYGLPIQWKILDTQKDNLSSPVISGTDTWIAGKLKKGPHAEEAFGYSFEKVVLCAQSLGIGTTWIAGTMDRKAFEKAMEVAEDEVLPSVSPLGHPSEKMSMREKMMRKGIAADKRLVFEEVFSKDSFATPLAYEEAGELQEALEAVRLAPSAVNRQPWRVVVTDGMVHFYEKPAKGFVSDGWDIQKIDMGIALCHFETVAAECGLSLTFVNEDPHIAGDEGLVYIAGYRIG